MAESKKSNRKQDPLYLVITPVEQLIDEGMIFEGDNSKDQMLNYADFLAFRGIYTRFETGLSVDERVSLIRSMKQMIKPEFLA